MTIIKASKNFEEDLPPNPALMAAMDKLTEESRCGYRALCHAQDLVPRRREE